MLNAELAFRAKDIVLDVRSFSVEEALSQPFEALVTARSESSDLDLDAIVGYGAAFRLAVGADLTSDRKPYRVWSGVCSHAEQVRVEPDGVSTYCVRIMPMFWRTTQRRNHRIYQHVTVPELVTGLLEEYGIEPELRLDPSAYPRHEYRVQYGETDFAFISRMLEEAGVCYLFEQVDPAGEGELESMKLVLVERPGEARGRRGDAIPYIGDTEQWPDSPFISNVRFSRQLRPGRFTIRDYDFRSSPDLRLLASVRARVASEERYELYHYQPGAFLCEPGQGQKQGGRGRSAGEARVDEQLGQARAEMGLDSVRTGRRTLSFRSNVADLHPGTVFRMSEFPRREISDKTDLLLVRRTIDGDVEELTDMHAEATLADEPYRPARHTPKPRMSGIQSAIVVGPEGEEIYTDEYGRVRVQFHWDREGKHDENSSCWIRVTQAWAGSGWGITSVPRVGTEVMVDFFEGDPDKPVIIGCVHNSACRTPYALPEHRTKTTWKSSTSPGAGGSNEITFEDARGEEKVYVHAQRDLEQRVEANEIRTTGANLNAIVVQNEEREVQGDQNIVVRGDRNVDNDGRSAQRAEQGMAMGSGEAGMACQQGAVTMTNGQTSMMLDGPNLYIDCAGNVQITAGRMLTLSGKQVRIIGDPEVFINCHDAVRPNVRQMPGFWMTGAAAEAGERDRTGRRRGRAHGRAEDPGDMDEAEFDRVRRGRRRDEMPDRVRAPRAVNEQLRGQARRTGRGSRTGRLLDALTFASMKRNLDRRLRFEERRLEGLSRDLQHIVGNEDEQGLVADLGDRLKEERENLADFFEDVGDVFEGEHGGFVDSCGALYDAFREQARNIALLRSDLLDLIESEKQVFEGAIDIWEDFKEIIEDPGDALLDILFGDQADEVGGIVDSIFGDAGDTAGSAAEAAAGAAGHAPRAPGGLGLGEEAAGAGAGRPDHWTRQAGARQASSGSGLKETVRGRGMASRQPGGQGLKETVRGRGMTSDGGGRSLREAAARHRAAAQQMSGPSPLKEGAMKDAVRARGMSSTQPGAQRMQDAVRGRGMASTQPSAQGMQDAVRGHGMASTEPSGAGMADAVQGRGLSTSAGSGGVDGAGSFHQAAGDTGGITAAPSGGQPIGTAGTSFSRSGGLAASDVAGHVGSDDVSFLQSPSDGQLMVVPTESATRVDQGAISSAMVNAQMAGQPVKPAVAESLSGSGYVVYERGWGDWFGEFVRIGQSQMG